jgi:hypothetical protein
MAYVNYGEFAPAVPISGYVAVPKNKIIEYEIFAVDAFSYTLNELGYENK